MNKRNLYLYLVAVIAMIICSNYAAAFNYGSLPVNRIPADGWKNIQWVDPGGWTTIDVTTKGLAANNAGIDASGKIEQIVNSGSGNRILYFPAGKYYFRSECTIKKNGIRLKGAGKDKTEFIFDAPTTTQVTIKFEGSFNTTGAGLTADPGVGGSAIQVSSASGYNVGDFVWLDAEDFAVKQLDGKLHYSCRGQTVKITSKSGNTLGIDMKMGVSLPLQYNPKAKKVNMVKNVGVEDLKIHRVRYNNNSYNVYMFCVQNGFIRNIESSYTAKMHLYAYRCRDIVMSGNYVHHGYDYGAGGNGYGIVFGGSGSRCLAINNTFTILRHDMLYQKGANHCIFAYNTVLENRSNPNSITLHGIYCHSNLMEGNTIIANANVVADAAHGMNGPNNWFFRNKCKEVGALHSINKRSCTVGNEAVKVWDIDAADDFVGANIVGGKMQWGDLSSSSKIPASMFLTSKPSFVAKWPLHGPGASSGPVVEEPKDTVETPSGNDAAVLASSDDGNVPANTLDGDLSTRWSADGDGEWIRFDLGESKPVSSVNMAFYRGDSRATYFDIQVSSDGSSWTDVLMGQESSGNSNDLEQFAFGSPVNARYVKITGHGNSANTWNSITEVVISTGGTTGIDHGTVEPAPRLDMVRLFDMNGKLRYSGTRQDFSRMVQTGIYLAESAEGLIKIMVP